MARILVAMSGGVDSSVAAALLVDAGHDVTGVTLKLWGGASDSGCCSVSDVEDARRVAHRLGIEHHVFNFADDFERFVVGPYVADHEQGRTPNPCIECNRHLKFDRLLARAEVLGFDTIATGHHARILPGPGGTRVLGRGADAAKDQSYVLYMLDQHQLSRLELPVGAMTKDEVRRLATEWNLPTADKADSQDVCFIHSSEGRQTFLGDRIPLTPARIVDRDGTVVGQTSAVELVTVGQRKGLGLAGNAARNYVVDVDLPGRVVTVGPEAATRSASTPLEKVTWSTDLRPQAVLAQCSAHGQAASASLTMVTDRPGHLDLEWDEPNRRVAVGQSVVFYQDDWVLGGGIVRRQPNESPADGSERSGETS